MPTKIFTACLGTETNSFSPIPTGMDLFRRTMFVRGGAHGDMVVELFVETPTHLSAKQKELLKQFAAECCPSGKCHPESQGFFKKVKKFFDQEDSRA